MNEVQRRVIAETDEKMRPALELYEHRNRMFHLVCLLSLRDLKRLTDLVKTLTPDELKDVAAYAEGLAAWRLPAQESQDAPIPQQGPQATAPGSGPGTGG